ncbi:hypothetical protein CEE55_04100 [Stenotrophomonas pavanii]|nr:hypothetical protein CEE55_04100 [Stenotrophomonas pavanii]
MKKNRLVAGILLLQVIVATACVTSIAFLLAQRLETLAYATGLQEQGLGIIETEFVGSAAANAAAAVKADMQVLRNVARVQAVVAAESLPLSQHNLTVGFTNVPVQGPGHGRERAGSRPGAAGCLSAGATGGAQGPRGRSQQHLTDPKGDLVSLAVAIA